MTRAEFYKHLLDNQCETFPLSEYGRATAVGIKNKKNKNTAFLDTPLDERPIKAASVCQICMRLGVQIPECVSHVEGLINHIKNKDFNRD